MLINYSSNLILQEMIYFWVGFCFQNKGKKLSNKHLRHLFKNRLQQGFRKESQYKQLKNRCLLNKKVQSPSQSPKKLKTILQTQQRICKCQCLYLNKTLNFLKFGLQLKKLSIIFEGKFKKEMGLWHNQLQKKKEIQLCMKNLKKIPNFLHSYKRI